MPNLNKKEITTIIAGLRYLQYATSVWHNPALAASNAAARIDPRLAKVAKQVEKERRNGFEAIPARKVNWHRA